MFAGAADTVLCLACEAEVLVDVLEAFEVEDPFNSDALGLSDGEGCKCSEAGRGDDETLGDDLSMEVDIGVDSNGALLGCQDFPSHHSTFTLDVDHAGVLSFVVGSMYKVWKEKSTGKIIKAQRVPKKIPKVTRRRRSLTHVQKPRDAIASKVANQISVARDIKEREPFWTFWSIGISELALGFHVSGMCVRYYG